MLTLKHIQIYIEHLLYELILNIHTIQPHP